MNREKLENFWYYNKWFIIGGAFFLALAIHLVVSIATNQDASFTALLLNCAQREQSSALADDFAAYAQIDQEEQGPVSFDSGITLSDEGSEQNVQMLQVIVARIAAQEIDVIAANTDNFELYAYNTGGIFADLREWMDEAALDELEGNLFYIDQAFEEQIMENADNAEAVESLVFPDPFAPEKMEEPIPVGIRIDSCKAFSDSYSSGGAAVYMGIVSNAPHPTLAVKLAEYLHAEN